MQTPAGNGDGQEQKTERECGGVIVRATVTRAKPVSAVLASVRDSIRKVLVSKEERHLDIDINNDGKIGDRDIAGTEDIPLVSYELRVTSYELQVTSKRVP